MLVTFDEQHRTAGPAFDQIGITYIKTSKNRTRLQMPTLKSISGNVLTITHSSAFPASSSPSVTLPAQVLYGWHRQPVGPVLQFRFTTPARRLRTLPKSPLGRAVPRPSSYDPRLDLGTMPGVLIAGTSECAPAYLL